MATKRQFAATMVRANNAGQMLENASENLFKIISSSFSALATIDPDAAIFALNELEKNRANIIKLSEDREKSNERQIDAITSSLSDSLEFEDESEQDDE
jgi:transglutaminase/protease-like cytokinesis protein 3